MGLPRGVISLLLASIVAGCAVDQKKEVETYQNVLHANLLSNDPAFTLGQPLTLRQALDLANHQNERLAVEGENYLQALIDRKRAAAAFLPTVNIVPTYEFRENANTGSSGNSSLMRWISSSLLACLM